MHQHTSRNRTVMAIIAAATLLLSGSLYPGFSRDQWNSSRHRSQTTQRSPEPNHRQPQRIERHYSGGNDHHYSYRQGSWYSHTPRGRFAVSAPFGALVVSLPGIFRTAVFGASTYYYCNGVFYNRHPHGYEIVRPPRLRYLPVSARRVVIGGCAYFHHDNFYYRYQDGFFEVCEPPVVVEQEASAEAPVTIMVDNSNGSRTPVTLDPMGSNQWKGPKGEIYDGLPSDDQLREAYGF